MKKTLVLALMALAAGGAARGEFSLSSDLTFASEYVFRGIKFADNTLHPSIEFGSEGFYGGMWAALPINDRSSAGYSDEYDFYVGYSPELSDTLSLDFGLTDYYYPQLDGDSTFEAYAGVTADFSGLTPTLYVYHDFDLETTTVQGSLGFSIPLASAGASLDLSGTLGWVDIGDAGAGDDSYVYYGASAVVPYKINENATVTVGAHWATNDYTGADDNFLFFTAGVTIGF